MPSSFTRILSLGKLQLYTSLSSDEYQTAIVGEVSAAYNTEPVKHQTSTSSKGPREANGCACLMTKKLSHVLVVWF
jgi:hypothetical protein